MQVYYLHNNKVMGRSMEVLYLETLNKTINFFKNQKIKIKIKQTSTTSTKKMIIFCGCITNIY